jgi:hypothetical protein
MEAYGNLWYSYQIGDAFIDLSIHLFDTYTRSKVHAAPPLNPNPMPRDDHTRNPPNRYGGSSWRIRSCSTITLTKEGSSNYVSSRRSKESGSKNKEGY